MSPWRVEDHTADLAISVSAPGFAALLEEAARAFHDVVGGGLSAEETVEREVRVEGTDRVEVWVRWWRALLRLWTVEGCLPLAAEVARADEREALGVVRCAPAKALDPSLVTDVKAVTWHRAEVRAEEGEWCGTIVLDV